MTVQIALHILPKCNEQMLKPPCKENVNCSRCFNPIHHVSRIEASDKDNWEGTKYSHCLSQEHLE